VNLRRGVRSEEDGRFAAWLKPPRELHSESEGTGVPCLSGHADLQASQSQRELRRRVGLRARSPAFKVVGPGVLCDPDLQHSEGDEAFEKVARGQPG